MGRRCATGLADGRAHGHVRDPEVRRPRHGGALASDELHHARHEARQAQLAQALVCHCSLARFWHGVASVGLLQRRLDKISAWKGKMDEDEMVDAELTRSHVVSRSAADVQAELDLVARLISGLPTNVEPGEYEAALQTHLASLSSALQLELEQTPEESGTNCSVRHRCPVVPLAVARAVHRTLRVAIMCSYVCACTATAESTLLYPEPSVNAEPNSPHANVRIVRTRSLPSLLYL
jgi:hypothetical protein